MLFRSRLRDFLTHGGDWRQEVAEAQAWYERSLPGLEDAQRKKTLESRDGLMIPEAKEALQKCREMMGQK